MRALTVTDLVASYGQGVVLHGVSLSVEAGEVVVVLGVNGAGKTTLLRAITGLMSKIQGTVDVDGVQVQGLSPADILRHGVAHVPQGRGTFASLSVEENLRVGGLTRSKEAVDSDINRWYERIPWLANRRGQAAGSLSGGEQQMLAVARAFMSNPKYVLLDEPSLGLAPKIIEQIYDTLREIQQELKIGMLIVEQFADFALEIASAGFVMESGVIVAHGSAKELAHSDSIRQAYLGA
ncbi:MAG: ABC transporter ATP-binding protein [Thermovirgaceae bacterium]